MTTRTSTRRAIEIPELVGDKADEAIQRLRELGLMPVMWSTEVDDVNEAGFVLGLDPPAGTPVRPKAPVTMSVATHPDFQGHADDSLAAESDELVQPPLTWPLSSPTGIAPATPAPSSEVPTDASPTAATPGAPSAPASSPIDAASREVRQPDVAASSAEAPTPRVAADPYDVSAPVPTPDEISAEDEWTRLRAAEAARHAADHPASDGLQAPPVAVIEPSSEETAGQLSADALEEQARREARRRRARRRRRLTLKQKAIVASVVAVTVLIGVMAISGHKPQADLAKTAHVASHHHRRSARTTSTPATGSHGHPKSAAHHKRTKAASGTARHAHRRSHKPRHGRIQTRATTVTVHASAPSTTSTNDTSPVAPANTAPSNTAPASTGAGSPTTATPPASNPPAASTPSHQSTSTPSASGSRSSGTGGGSTLQSPDGTTAPPQP